MRVGRCDHLFHDGENVLDLSRVGVRQSGDFRQHIDIRRKIVQHHEVRYDPVLLALEVVLCIAAVVVALPLFLLLFWSRRCQFLVEAFVCQVGCVCPFLVVVCFVLSLLYESFFFFSASSIAVL